MENRGSTLILTNLVGVHPRNIHKKIESNQCSGLREEVHADNKDDNDNKDDDDGHRVIARVTLTR